MSDSPIGTTRTRWRSRARMACVPLAAAAVAVAIFGVPFGTVLSVGMLLLCPLMMMTGMHAAGHHRARAGEPERTDDSGKGRT